MKNIIKKLDKDKIKINWNKNPIPMELFLSFLTIPYTKSTDYLGESTGWTQYENKDHKLTITGGLCDGGHWLNWLEYGTNLQNPYNNYVSPFHMFDILNDEGKKFFVNYYKEDIKKVVLDQVEAVGAIERKLASEKEHLKVLDEEFDKLIRLVE